MQRRLSGGKESARQRSPALLRIVAVVARVSTELEELKRAENSPSLWKLHADSLLALLEATRALSEHAAETMAEATEQDNRAGAEAIKISLQRLRHRLDAGMAALAEMGGRAVKV